MARFFKIIFGLVAVAGLIGIGLAFWGMSEIDRHEAMSPQERKAEAAKYAAAEADRRRKSLIENADGHQCQNGDGEIESVIGLIRPFLREPDTFAHDQTRIGKVGPDGRHDVWMRYRTKNGFGGVSIETVEATVSNFDCSARFKVD